MTTAPSIRTFTVFLALFVVASLAACAPASETAGNGPALFDDQLAWKVDFGSVPPGDVAAFEVSLVRGSCAGSDAIDTNEVSSNGKGITPTGLAAGSYAIVLRARDRECRLIAAGCSTFQIPVKTREVLSVRIEPMRPRFDCSAAQCTAGRCSGGTDTPDAGPILTTPDAGGMTDAGMEDAGSDANVALPPPPAIYGIKKGIVPVGTVATVEGIVTAVELNKSTGAVRGLFVQVPEALHQLPQYGYGFSGIYVFVDTAAALVTGVKRGQSVSIRGMLQNFYNQIQMFQLEAFEILASDQTLPTPQMAAPADIATGGKLASSFEGVLVQVDRAAVDSTLPVPGTGDDAKNEFSVGGGLRINDMFYVVSPLPDPGTLMSVTGPLRFSHDNSKIEPRDATDIVYHIAPKAFSSPRVCLPLGVSGGSSNPALRLELTSKAPAGGLAVALSSSSAYVQVPASLVVPQGANSVEVLLTAVGSTVGSATVTATLDGSSVSTQVTLQVDGQVKLATITPDQAAVPYKGSATLTAVLSCPAPAGGLDFTVASDSPAVTVDSALRFEAGEFEKTINVTGSAAGTAKVSVTRDTDTLFATVGVTTVLLSEIFYDPSGLDDGLEWVELYNPTDLTIDLGAYTLSSTRNTSLADFPTQLSGSIAPGQCLVVGGGPATLKVALSMENANGRADGVALYNLLASAVNASRMPVEYVMYGPSDTGPDDTTKNNIKDWLGNFLPPDVGAAASNQSVARHPTGWVINLVPTPGDCSALSGP